jgi:hypothetical protein
MPGSEYGAPGKTSRLSEEVARLATSILHAKSSEENVKQYMRKSAEFSEDAMFVDMTDLERQSSDHPGSDWAISSFVLIHCLQ